jgi:subfamily B ATP-binding cassette protein HlyB/CyaB
VTTARIAREDFLWLLGSLCQIAGSPSTPPSSPRNFPRRSPPSTLHEAARALGFRTGERRAEAAVLPGLTFGPPSPSCARRPMRRRRRGAPTQLHVVREGEVEESPEPEPLRPALILRADANQLLYFCAGSEQPETLPLAEFDLYFEPT